MTHPDVGGSQPAHALLDLIHASWAAQAVHVAAELRLVDLLHRGPRTACNLSHATGADEAALARLLRALCTLGLLAQHDDGSFSATPAGAPLAEDHPHTIRSWALWWGGSMWATWGLLGHSIRTGESARTTELGTRGFEHLDDDPAQAAVFHRALVELTRLATPGILRAFDFSGIRTVVDVGGGYGELLRAILAAHPACRGILLDRPHAIEGARNHLTAAGLADRCTFVDGDFFKTVPEGGDVYLLKTVLHDWDDAHAARILSACRRAMAPRSRLLIIERLMPDRLGNEAAHRALARSDLSMLIAHGAPERTREEFDRLLRAAHLELMSAIPAGGPLQVLEARPLT